MLCSGYAFIDCGNETAAATVGQYEIRNATNVTVTYTITPDPSASNLTSNVTHGVSTRYNLLTPEERSLRAFAPNSTGCYNLTIQPGIWSIRLGFAYYNYDGLSAPPEFNVTLDGFAVDQVHLVDWEGVGFTGPAGEAPSGKGAGYAHYTEYVYNAGERLAVCLVSTDGSAPILNTLELVRYGPGVLPMAAAYIPPDVSTWVLSLKHRIKLGSAADITPAADPYLRTWHAADPDTLVQFPALGPSYSSLNITPAQSVVVKGFWSDTPTPLLPTPLFESAAQGGALNNAGGTQFLGVSLPFRAQHPRHHLMARLFFVELNPNVTVGQRVFDITFASASKSATNGSSYEITRWVPDEYSFAFDIYGGIHNQQNPSTPGPVSEAIGYYTAHMGCYPTPPNTTEGGEASLQELFVFLEGEASSLPPLLSGVELYEVVTDDSEVELCLGVEDPTVSDATPAAFPPTVRHGSEEPLPLPLPCSHRTKCWSWS